MASVCTVSGAFPVFSWKSSKFWPQNPRGESRFRKEERGNQDEHESGGDPEEVCDEQGVRFLRLQFTDILGIIKNVEVPRSQFEKALDGQIQFDGSSIEGFTRIEESDMGLVPDLETFRVYPWSHSNGKVARLVCDVIEPDGSPLPDARGRR